jgi:hypothetical protein
MDKNEKFEVLRKKHTEMQKLKQELLETSNKIFIEFTKTIFEEYPKIKSFSWKQYTPYFNDGDTCTFSVDTNYICVNDEYVDEVNWLHPTNITNYGNWNRELKVYEGQVETPNSEYDEEMAKAVEEIREFLSEFDDDFYLHQFGDHAEVTITADGVSIDEYDHD